MSTVARIAVEFCKIVRRDLLRHLEEINRLNRKRGRKYCHTHDFCDANKLMDEAFRHVVGREPDFDRHLHDMGLWNGAWNMAIRSGFSLGGTR